MVEIAKCCKRHSMLCWQSSTVRGVQSIPWCFLFLRYQSHLLSRTTLQKRRCLHIDLYTTLPYIRKPWYLSYIHKRPHGARAPGYANKTQEPNKQNASYIPPNQPPKTPLKTKGTRNLTNFRKTIVSSVSSKAPPTKRQTTPSQSQSSSDRETPPPHC